jgi:hypothetical protein
VQIYVKKVLQRLDTQIQKLIVLVMDEAPSMAGMNIAILQLSATVWTADGKFIICHCLNWHKNQCA